MPTTVLYPKVSLEMSTGRIARWRVADGDAVAAGQILFEIDNDKAAVEVEAPAAGIVEPLVGEGDEVEVGAGVALIRGPGEARTAPPTGAGKPPEGRAAAGSSIVIPTRSPEAPRRPPNPTPLARRIARDHGLSLEGRNGTGPRGRVRSADVLAMLAGPAAASDAKPAARLMPEAATNRVLHAKWLRKGEGDPVVLLHGFAGDMNTWRAFLGGIGSRWPILALDLPGHGFSPREAPQDLDATAEAVEATLAAVGIGASVLVGHSLGGAVLAKVAARGQADVRALCLLSPAGLGPQIDAAFLEGILRASRPESLRPWLERLVHDPAVITEAFVQSVAAQRADVDLTRSMEQVAARFFPDGTQRFSIGPDLARLRIPTRIVFGRQDRILPFSATRTLPGHVALHALDDCGHMPQLEHPDLCARIIDEIRRSA
jgi:pimeloyl-ACP methyl ester carboxylesterase